MKIVTTAQYTITELSDGLQGENAIVAVLDNDSHVIPTDVDGDNGNYTGANTTISIFNGSKDDTSNWSISVSVDEGITGNLKNSTYTITHLSKNTDNGSVHFIASKSGYDDVRKTFTITKSKQGFAGGNAVVHSLNTDLSHIQKDLLAETMTPESITLTSLSKIADKEAEEFPAYFTVYEQSGDAITVDEYADLVVKQQITQDREYVLSSTPYPYVERYSSATKESIVKYTPNFSAVGIKIELYRDSERKILIDSQTISVVSNGLTPYTHTAYSNSEDGTLDFDITNSVNKLYFGQYTDFIKEDSKDPSKYTWMKTKGEKGDRGDGSTAYWLTNISGAIQKNDAGAYSPASLNIRAMSQSGETPPTAYAGRFVISETTNGTTWTDKYTSSANESNKTYTMGANISALRIRMYLAGGTISLVDEQTIPIVKDGSNPIVAVISTPKGTIMKNSEGSLEAELTLYKGGTAMTGTNFKWYELDTTVTGGWRQLTAANPDNTTGYTTKKLTVTAKSIVSNNTYKGAATYNGVEYSAMITFTDISDPISTVIVGSGVFRNGVGENTFKAVVYRNGMEIDKNGTEYSYKWNMIDRNGVVDSSWTATGKTIKVSADHYKETTQLKCDIDDGN